MHWGESDVETPRLIEELKAAARREGLTLPGDAKLGLHAKSEETLTRRLSDYQHLYVKFLRGGGMDVATTLQVVKSLIREYRVVPNLLPFTFPAQPRNSHVRELPDMMSANFFGFLIPLVHIWN